MPTATPMAVRGGSTRVKQRTTPPHRSTVTGTESFMSPTAASKARKSASPKAALTPSTFIEPAQDANLDNFDARGVDWSAGAVEQSTKQELLDDLVVTPVPSGDPNGFGDINDHGKDDSEGIGSNKCSTDLSQTNHSERAGSHRSTSDNDSSAVDIQQPRREYLLSKESNSIFELEHKLRCLQEEKLIASRDSARHRATVHLQQGQINRLEMELSAYRSEQRETRQLSGRFEHAFYQLALMVQKYNVIGYGEDDDPVLAEVHHVLKKLVEPLE